ncbi:hypothetical protein SBOR_4431 [Sclerotinia borealis F-4128]|uniref:Uncharacterized protein n=1 Tax=Sclerotinia borealis (strain F-4128) TaxID=1432307 RepID=W9CL02_SCLBF|nr:hypothetical protein SBOR_4431 [Sclerotinia borealis F-4128]
MFKSTHKAAKDLITGLNADEDDVTTLPNHFLPESYSFEDLYRELVKEIVKGKDEEIENIIILASCLEHKSDAVLAADDGKWCEKLKDYLSETILPDGKVYSLDETDDKAFKIKQYRFKYTLCMVSISRLLELSPNPSSSPPKNSTLLSLIPYTTTKNPWTTSQSQRIAAAILEKHDLYIKSPEFLVTHLLQSFIRPIFSKTPAPKSVTASSRKAAPSSAPPRHFDIRELSPSRQPWRSNIPYTIPILQWIIEYIPSDLLRTQAFPLLIPPLLTLLDSPSNSIRIRTLQLLPTLFSKMGDKLLLQTGLGDVFEDAIHPVLLFLPSITPVEDTLSLLLVGYHALYALYDTRWPSTKDEETGTRELTLSINKPSKPTNPTSKSPTHLRLAFLDRIIRHAILPAHLHCQEIPSVVQILISQLGICISKMGIWGVKHLKDILPIITNILMNPFLPRASPSLIIETLNTLREIILVLWPRISFDVHRLIILQALALLHGNVGTELADASEDEAIKNTQGEIMKGLRQTARVFVVAVKGTEDEDVKGIFEEELDSVIEANGDLATLFRF